MQSQNPKWLKSPHPETKPTDSKHGNDPRHCGNLRKGQQTVDPSIVLSPSTPALVCFFPWKGANYSARLSNLFNSPAGMEQQLSWYIHRYLVWSAKDPVSCHTHSDSVFPLVSDKVKPADAECLSPCIVHRDRGEFSALGKKASVSPPTPFVLMFSWLGATERLSTNTQSRASPLPGFYTNSSVFWMTAFTPSAGKMRRTHIYAHSAKIPCQGSSDNQILWASSVSPGSLLLSDCLLMLSTLLQSLSLPSACLQIFFFFFKLRQFWGF